MHTTRKGAFCALLNAGTTRDAARLYSKEERVAEARMEYCLDCAAEALVGCENCLICAPLKHRTNADIRRLDPFFLFLCPELYASVAVVVAHVVKARHSMIVLRFAKLPFYLMRPSPLQLLF